MKKRKMWAVLCNGGLYQVFFEKLDAEYFVEREEYGNGVEWKIVPGVFTYQIPKPKKARGRK